MPCVHRFIEIFLPSSDSSTGWTATSPRRWSGDGAHRPRDGRAPVGECGAPARVEMVAAKVELFLHDPRAEIRCGWPGPQRRHKSLSRRPRGPITGLGVDGVMGAAYRAWAQLHTSLLEPQRESPHPRGRGAEGANLPKNLSGPVTAAGRRTLKSQAPGLRPRCKPPLPAVKLSGP